MNDIMERSVGNVRRGIRWGLNDTLEDLDFADDICLLSHSFGDMQNKVNTLLEVIKGAHMKINVKKTKEMRLNSKKTDKVIINNNNIDTVQEFKYLGSIIDKDGGAFEDVKNRIKNANSAFVQLYPIWKSYIISRSTKIKIFNSNVKSVLLYGCETWKTSKIIQNKLQTFVNRCLRRILKIRWPDIITNSELWKITNQKEITIEIKRRKWNWIGHTIRKEDGAVERMALDWNPQGSRTRGRPKNTWKRTVLEEIAREGKTWSEVKKLATNRVRWRHSVNALCSS